jgi:hypothetical protein
MFVQMRSYIQDAATRNVVEIGGLLKDLTDIEKLQKVEPAPVTKVPAMDKVPTSKIPVSTNIPSPTAPPEPSEEPEEIVPVEEPPKVYGNEKTLGRKRQG